MKRVRILLVEENRILRESIASIIKTQPDMKVVAAHGRSAGILHMAHESNPHILLMDFSPRNQNGEQIVKSVHRDLPEIKVIGTGLTSAQPDIARFVRAGASGFIMKEATGADFLRTIRAVAKGKKSVPRPLTRSLPAPPVIDREFAGEKIMLPKAVRMTKREREIVALIADGLSNKEISLRLNVATHTVKSHVHNVLGKLALQSRLQIFSFIHNVEGEP